MQVTSFGQSGDNAEVEEAEEEAAAEVASAKGKMQFSTNYSPTTPPPLHNRILITMVALTLVATATQVMMNFAGRKTEAGRPRERRGGREGDPQERQEELNGE